ncbi:alpha/beta hydrolase [Virgibacillus halodenitrificans]|jgi:acetyl esterase/lipase|uniref:alpha/beta hydrolase n=1 Tax=Virgibacillus halodenitrificans TaxID=1482 RepID=UPI001F1F3A2A|nr:alpha/beta hydrolase [Virgibacillus halodenitrificans]MCJ0929965.1 alpha/beta hydrolase [Virgibacillus halodenitrificans]
MIEERVHPDLKKYFQGLTEKNIDNVKELRAGDEREAVPVHENIEITNRYIQGEKEHEIRLRMYTNIEADQGEKPCLLWIHGGGYISGKPEINDRLCQRFVLEAICTVVSVAYRLAPENPYPAALNDCYTALKWITDHATELKVKPEKVAVAGVSAGGGLVAALSLLARDRNGPKIAFQMPLYPMIDNRLATSSSQEISDLRIWNGIFTQKAWKHYLGDLPMESIDMYAVPSLAENYRNLPSTYTCVGDLDPFKDETLEYVQKLSEAGVPVEFHLYPGCFHGFESMVPEAAISKKAESEYVSALRFAFYNR